MKRTFILMFTAVILLALVACNKAVKNNDLQNEQSSTSQIETSPDSESPLSTANSTSKPTEGSTTTTNSSPKENDTMINIKISVNGSVFSAKFYDNGISRTLIAKFPMTLNMSELNGNEKYYYLPDKLPIDSQRVGSINSGDLMLYGSDCLVLFYKSFSTSYSYTRIGYINDVSGLAAALGSGSVQIAFAVSS